MSETARQPRQRLSPAARREQLASAAVAVVSSRGYQATTAEAVVREAGVSKGLLWHYFADLDDLLEYTARQTLMVLARAVGNEIDLTAPAPEVIRNAVHGAARLLQSHRTERRALQEIVPNLRTSDGALRLDLSDYDELYAAQEAIFRRGQQEGDFRADHDPRLLAVTYQGAVDAMLGYLDVHPDDDPERHAATVADVLLSGINRHR